MNKFAHQALKNLKILYFEDIESLKSYFTKAFEEVEFEDFFPEEADEDCDCYHITFKSKYYDYVLYYLKTRNDHIVVVDALPLNK